MRHICGRRGSLPDGFREVGLGGAFFKDGASGRFMALLAHDSKERRTGRRHPQTPPTHSTSFKSPRSWFLSSPAVATHEGRSVDSGVCCVLRHLVLMLSCMTSLL